MLLEKLMHLTPDEQVDAYQHRERYFPMRWMRKSDKPSVLKRREDKDLGEAADAFLKSNLSRAALILKDGEIVVERYQPGLSEKSRWISFSVGKSYVSTLVGAALKDGAIASLQDPMTKYLPQLKGSAYEGATIHHCLQMSSGVKWVDGYRDPDSPFAQMYKGIEARQDGAVIKVMASLPREAEPGARFCYNTGETHLLGMVVTAATGKRLTPYMEEKIWHPVGMEADANWGLESDDGQELAGGAISMCLRDWGRFGQFFLGGGIAAGQEVLPKGWLQRAAYPGPKEPHLEAGRLEPPNLLGYGYQWWPFARDGGEWPAHAGAFTGMGIFGQFLYINPRERIVAVIWSTWPDPWVVENERRAYDFLAKAVERLRQSLY